jgi:hypothetical protein
MLSAIMLIGKASQFVPLLLLQGDFSGAIYDCCLILKHRYFQSNVMAGLFIGECFRSFPVLYLWEHWTRCMSMW